MAHVVGLEPGIRRSPPPKPPLTWPNDMLWRLHAPPVGEFCRRFRIPQPTQLLQRGAACGGNRSRTIGPGAPVAGQRSLSNGPRPSRSASSKTENAQAATRPASAPDRPKSLARRLHVPKLITVRNMAVTASTASESRSGRTRAIAILTASVRRLLRRLVVAIAGESTSAVAAIRASAVKSTPSSENSRKLISSACGIWSRSASTIRPPRCPS